MPGWWGGCSAWLPIMEATLVGRILRGAEQYGSYPCHRVVNHAGRLAPGWPEQAALLAAEGVFLNQRGCVDLARDQWDC